MPKDAIKTIAECKAQAYLWSMEIKLQEQHYIVDSPYEHAWVVKHRKKGHAVRRFYY